MNLVLKIFAARGKVEKKSGEKKEKKTASFRALLKKKMNPHKRVGG